MPDLTQRQRGIAQLAARGMPNRDIAGKLFTSPRTDGV